MMKYDDFMDNLGTTRDGAFDEVFRLGTITGTAGTEKMDIIEDNTFNNWTTNMKVEANKTGIELELTVNSVTITHTEPWMVDVTVRLDIDAQDEKNTASWTITNKAYTGKINITGLVDPLYLVNNNGLVNNTIIKTTVPDFSSETNLDLHVLNSYYIEHSDAPSYLMRFENDLGSSAYGIESLVNSQELIDASLDDCTDSAVDFICFGTGVASCEVKEPNYSWFRLDTATHLDFYEAECQGGS